MLGKNLFYIHVKVKAGVQHEALKKKNEDHFEVSVREKAEHNMANKRIIQIISEYFSVLPKNVRIINGHQHPSKLLVVER